MVRELDESDGWFFVDGSGLAHYMSGDESRCGRFKRSRVMWRVAERGAVEICQKCIYGEGG